MREPLPYVVPQPIVRVLNTRPITVPVWLVQASKRIGYLLDLIARDFYIDPIDIMSGRYDGDVVEARQIAYWVLRRSSSMSLSQIAHKLNRKDHTSAKAGIDAIDDKRLFNFKFRDATDKILAEYMAYKAKPLAA